MASSSEGSAAEGQQDADDSGQRGLFGRLLNAFSTQQETEEGREPLSDPNVAAATGPQTFGLSNLRSLRVDDVAVPVAEIAAVPIDIEKDALVEVFREHGFSRLPVYKETLDKPLGLVLLKDLALQYGFGAGNGRFVLRKLLRPLLYAPPSMPVGVLLQKMQRDRVHMALVIDEYGGVDGLVTIEDLIETVIGEIEDEHDEAEGGLWSEEKPGVFIAQSRTPLDEFEAAIGMKLRGSEDEEEVDTLGGLVFVLVGRVPARGEVIPHESGVEFEVVDADPRRIKRLRVRLPGASALPVSQATSGPVGQGRAMPAPAAPVLPASAPAVLPAETPAEADR